MRYNRLFLALLITSIITIVYLIWWSYYGEYSGSYTHLYGYIWTDKLAFAAVLILLINGLISLIKLWRDIKYLVLIIGSGTAIFIWLQIFYSGTEILRLTGCFESVCSDISIRDNGSFWMTVTTQSDSHSYRGNYIVEDGEIYLYDRPDFDAEYQLDAIADLKQQKCVHVNAVDFNLWSGCFVLPPSH